MRLKSRLAEGAQFLPHVQCFGCLPTSVYPFREGISPSECADRIDSLDGRSVILVQREQHTLDLKAT